MKGNKTERDWNPTGNPSTQSKNQTCSRILIIIIIIPILFFTQEWFGQISVPAEAVRDILIR